MKAYQDCERVFLDLFDFENYKNENGEHTLFMAQQLEYDLIKSIPVQIEKFFEMQKYECDSDLFTEAKLSRALKSSVVERRPSNPDIKFPLQQMRSFREN